MNNETRDIVKLDLIEPNVIRRSPEVEHERAVAVYDLLEENRFRPDDMPEGPYHLALSIEDDRLIFGIHNTQNEALGEILLPIRPFRRIVRDYFMICESYYEAIKTSTLQQIEALDMGRRGIHNEGAELLQERLEGKAEIDEQTARRLFTLVCVLHIRG